MTASAERALTEIQRVVARAVKNGKNNKYIDEISDIITGQLIEEGSKEYPYEEVLDADERCGR